MKKIFIAAATALTLNAPAVQAAQNVTVEVTNVTHAMFFTPLLVAAHESSVDLWELGDPASDEVAAIAEGGDRSGAIALIENTRGVVAFEATPAGLVAPGATVSSTFRINNAKDRLSILGMLLPTNDGFVGLDSVSLPRSGNTRTVFVYGYDAGTEANNELIIDGSGAPGVAGIPADPGGNSVTGSAGVTTKEVNTNIHIHRNITGGFTSDLDAGIHGWDGPVARVRITVQ